MMIMIVKEGSNDFILDETTLRNMIFKAIDLAAEKAKSTANSQLRAVGIMSDMHTLPVYEIQDIADEVIAAEMQTMRIEE